MNTSNLPVIDDNNFKHWITGNGNPRNYARGYSGMWENELARSAAGSFADIGISLLPESEWKDRIRQLDKDEASIPDLCDELGSPVKNQGSLPYCWVFAPIRCAEIIRLIETGQPHLYSPASAGAPVKNFRRVGGWGSQALRYMVEYGFNYSSDWPDTAVNRSYYNDSNKEKAKQNIVLEYYILESWEERVSCILQGIPTADGYPWWSHEVTGVHLTLDYDLIIDNSWSVNWGDRGRGILRGRKKYAGDSVAITALMPN